MTPYSVFRHDDCYLYGKKYSFNNLNGGYGSPGTGRDCTDKTDTAEQCQHLCQATPKCKQFSWFGHDFWDEQRKRECCLKSIKQAQEKAKDLSDVVSGPKFCGRYLQVMLKIFSTTMLQYNS